MVAIVPGGFEGVSRWIKRLTSDEGELEADTLSSEVAASGAKAVCDCTAGEKVEILGKVRTVSLQPCDSLAALIAEIYDGTDAVDLIWLGRRTIAGIEVGRTIRATGRIAMRGGHKAMYNPSYQLIPTVV
jgi:hypothetical protein